MSNFLSAASVKSIGVFDSGMGGLTVLRELCKILPNESFIYLGDTARLPYGTKTKNTVLQYSKQMANFLAKQDVKMIIVACNTATVASLSCLKEIYSPLPIIGVVEPGSLIAANTTKTNKIGLIATETTILSQGYQKTLENINPKIKVYTQACNLLVSLAEEGFVSNEIAKLALKEYLTPIFNEDIAIDVLLLGCTHFPVFKEAIKNIVSNHVNIVDSAESTAKYVKQTLEKNNLVNNTANKATIKYFVTDNPLRFARIGSLFFGDNISEISTIDAI
jgi:glutamate racemase